MITTLATDHILKGVCPTHSCWIGTTNPLLATWALSQLPFLMMTMTRMENTIRWISIVLLVWCVTSRNRLNVEGRLWCARVEQFEVFLYGKAWGRAFHNLLTLRHIGIYATLFAICIRVLLRSKGGTKRVLIACAMMMFALATVDVVLELSFLFWFVVKQYSIPEERLHFKFLIFITSK